VPYDLHIEPLGEQVHKVAAHAVAVEDTDRATVHSRMHATCITVRHHGDRRRMSRRRGMRKDGFEKYKKEEEEEEVEDKKRR
jgi:hypothetical protein